MSIRSSVFFREQQEENKNGILFTVYLPRAKNLPGWLTENINAED